MDKHIPILEGRSIKVKRGNALLLDIPSFVVREGEVISLIGPNGAGKTTLLQALCRLSKPYQGEIFFKGLKVGSEYNLIDYRRKIAMVFQEPLLFNTTVFNNVASGLRFRGIRKSEIETIVKESLEQFGISHLSDRSARTLSGGEAQRTSLARAFATIPEILFLDEPFASLDLPTRETLIEDLERVLVQSRITTVFATHDRIEVLRLSDRVAVMNTGNIVQIGALEQVMNHPVDELVASFVGMETILHGKVLKEGKGTFIVGVSGQEIEVVGSLHIGDKVILCIRPENVTLSNTSGSLMTSARNVFHGIIEKIIPFGLYQKIELYCGFPLIASVTKGSVENLSLEKGKEVIVSFKATAIHVIKK